MTKNIETPEKKILIEISKVNQSFHIGEEVVDVLKNINFKIYENTFNIIYGASGSGKSTLLNILTGLQKPTTGKVTFEDRNLYELSPDELAHFRSSDIGIVYQQNFWVKSLNVIENVSLPLLFSGFSRGDANKLAYESLRMVGMDGFSKKHPALLSGGEQQRVALARALVNNPRLVIADEPTGGLDTANGDKVMATLQRCQTEQGRTVVLVSHNMEYIPLADHLLRIEDGLIQYTAGADDIGATAERLFTDMKDRINRLVKVKNNEQN